VAVSIVSPGSGKSDDPVGGSGTGGAWGVSADPVSNARLSHYDPWAGRTAAWGYALLIRRAAALRACN